VRRLAAVARKEYDMTRSIAVVVVPAFLFIAAGAAALQSSQQYPMMDAVAQKVIQKYQNASCTDLMVKKTTPPTDEQAQKRAQAIEAMRANREQAVRLRHDSLTCATHQERFNHR
jgi:hypothetical protein